tara:strand:+ start:9609 stop:9737 length:129 start_codon:yes stop_codon:yes gene_type:complete
MNPIKVHIKNLILNYLMELLEADNDNIYKKEVLNISKKIKEY